ncbi:hypothetical protein [Streptomyces sp. NPDC048637]|uniref:hypothetical protein n=1 Tax=Streptomyces sp. NPDC048637 TaxID=3155636 RepID=UPI00343F52D3
MRETMVPAAMTALDFSRLGEPPAAFGSGIGSPACDGSGALCSPAGFPPSARAESCGAAVRPDGTPPLPAAPGNGGFSAEPSYAARDAVA